MLSLYFAYFNLGRIQMYFCVFASLMTRATLSRGHITPSAAGWLPRSAPPLAHPPLARLQARHPLASATGLCTARSRQDSQQVAHGTQDRRQAGVLPRCNARAASCAERRLEPGCRALGERRGLGGACRVPTAVIARFGNCLHLSSVRIPCFTGRSYR